MAKGRKAKSGELAERQGNPGHRAIVKTPDTVAGLDGAAPGWLKQKGAREVWAALTPLLEPLRFVKQTDHIALARYCSHMARFIKLSQEMDKAGETYTTQTPFATMERLHPKFNAMMRTEEALVRLEDRLGLSPAARQTLIRGLAMAPPGDPGAAKQPNAQQPGAPLGLLANLHAQPTETTH